MTDLEKLQAIRIIVADSMREDELKKWKDKFKNIPKNEWHYQYAMSGRTPFQIVKDLQDDLNKKQELLEYCNEMIHTHITFRLT